MHVSMCVEARGEFVSVSSLCRVSSGNENKTLGCLVAQSPITHSHLHLSVSVFSVVCLFMTGSHTVALT